MAQASGSQGLSPPPPLGDVINLRCQFWDGGHVHLLEDNPFETILKSHVGEPLSWDPDSEYKPLGTLP